MSLISHLLSLIPTLPSILGPSLVKHFPYKRENELVLETYVRNMLGLVEGCPEVAGKVWEGIMDRLIRLDVGWLGYWVVSEAPVLTIGSYFLFAGRDSDRAGRPR
jgi:hypothetical protein